MAEGGVGLSVHCFCTLLHYHMERVYGCLLGALVRTNLPFYAQSLKVFYSFIICSVLSCHRDID